MNSQLQLAVSHAVEMARTRMAAGMLGAAADMKRPGAWCEYGWPDHVTTNMLIRLYQRGGLAFGAVDKLVGNCWRTDPWIIEGEKQDEASNATAWEESVKKALPEGFWSVFEEADRRRLAARYSAIVLLLRDGRALNQPVQGKRELVRVIPVWETAIKVAKYDTNTRNVTYGQPAMWEYRETLPDGTEGNLVQIHPDRVIILGDVSAGAVGYLEPAYNAFVNIEKIEGGSGESFLKNASRQIAVNFGENVDMDEMAAVYGVEKKDLQREFNKVAKALNTGIDSVLATQGAQTTTLVAATADPEPPYRVNLMTISAGCNIPAKILVGSQTGERASTEDAREWNLRCQSRRNRELDRDIRNTVRHLQRVSVIDTMGTFTIMWDDLAEATQGEKLANGKTMSEINQAAAAGGSGQPVFSDEEIRVVSGHEPNAATALPEGGGE